MDPHAVTALTAQAWADRHRLPPLTCERPDAVERQRPAVDLLGRDGSGRPRLVLEHTLVESFLDQRSVQRAAIRMFAPLEQMLSGHLPAPGHYCLALKPGAVLGLKREAERIREWVAGWVRATAPTLAVGRPSAGGRHCATITVPDTELTVTLYRWPRRDGQFELIFDAPSQAHQALTPPLTRALAAKCPKLADAKAVHAGAESLLVLEIHDIQLGNVFDLDAVVQTSIPDLAAVPDHIWLVDTADEPPSAMISKERERSGEVLVDRCAFSLVEAGRRA